MIFEFYSLKSSVNFLNVFQGDSAVIVNKSGNFLIDAGRKNYVLKPLVNALPFFEKTIDVVFISHADSDHSEGLNFVLDNYKVRVVVLNDLDFVNESYQKLLEKILDKNIKIVLGVKGGRVMAKDLDIKVLYPDRADLSLKNTNEKSEVLLIDNLNKKWLFTGDITAKILEKIVVGENVSDIDVLKVPHHGAKNTINSNTLALLKVKEAIISVGANNYGHPNGDIIKILEGFGAKVLRTDISGSIQIK